AEVRSKPTPVRGRGGGRVHAQRRRVAATVTAWLYQHSRGGEVSGSRLTASTTGELRDRLGLLPRTIDGAECETLVVGQCRCHIDRVQPRRAAAPGRRSRGGAARPPRPPPR